jgi:hypothetical protein
VVQPRRADLANIDAATVWALDKGDAEGAMRMAVGLDAFWIFSSPSAAIRMARLRAALDLPWSRRVSSAFARGRRLTTFSGYGRLEPTPPPPRI